MKVLVTGGAGFIGSNFIRYTLTTRANWHVVNLDKLTYAGNLDNLADIADDPARASRYSFVHGNIADRDLVNQVFEAEGPAVVVNFAAESHVDRSILDPAPFMETNVCGTQVLLEAARRHEVGRFIQISTDEVYGSLGPDDPPFSEESPLAPNSPYSASKAGADLIARAYYRTYGTPIIIARCTNNYGPYQHPEKFIPAMILCALQDRPLPIYGDGQNVRDWIHVEDHCRAIALLVEHGRIGEVYNIGAACERRNIDVARAILKSVGRPESLIRFVPDRPGHDRRYAVNAEKLRKETEWTPRYSLEDAIPVLVRWYQENKWPYRSSRRPATSSDASRKGLDARGATIDSLAPRWPV
ncbi:MAG: dTDP-glucose 4,6-dehydratase [Firmicutes bacterium]|nr:dTDP-glucose 4,6-dehydratase [Bacillota bacterium]